uniref:hypothetical protein n=1 Tax=Phenylobacterium sp. TaxID=1871053 RepID=UPI0030F40B9A
ARDAAAAAAGAANDAAGAANTAAGLADTARNGADGAADAANAAAGLANDKAVAAQTVVDAGATILAAKDAAVGSAAAAAVSETNAAANAAAAAQGAGLLNPWPDPFFREIQNSTTAYLGGRKRISAAFDSLAARVDSPYYPDGRSFKVLQASTGSRGFYMFPDEAGIAVGETMRFGVELSGLGQSVACNLIWQDGIGGNVGSAASWATLVTTNLTTPKRAVGSSVRPAGAVRLLVYFTKTVNTSDYYIDALWGHGAGTTIPSLPVLGPSTPLLPNRIVALESDVRRAKAAMLRRVSYATTSTVLAVSAGSSDPGNTLFFGWAQKCTPGGVTFNAIRVRQVRRRSDTPAAQNWATLNVVIRAGASNAHVGGAPVVAVGSVDLDPLVTSYDDILVPLRDPTTGAFKTLTDADLSAEYIVGAYALAVDGSPATLNPPTGALANKAADSYYMSSGSSLTDPKIATWSDRSGDVAVGLEHVFLTGRADSWVPTGTLQGQVQAVFQTQLDKAEWAADPAAAYTGAADVLRAASRGTSVRTSVFHGWGDILAPAGVSFNAIRLSSISAGPGVKKFKVVVRAAASGDAHKGTATLVAVGEVVVSTTATSFTDVYIPLTDPTTGLFKTLTNADLTAEYGVLVYCVDAAGAPIHMDEPTGAMPNRLGTPRSYYSANSNDPLTQDWGRYTGDSAIDVSHAMLSGLTNSYTFSVAALAKIAAAVQALTPTATPPTLLIPPKLYTVQGQEAHLYLDGLTAEDATDLDWNVDVASSLGGAGGLTMGQQRDEDWVCTPGAIGGAVSGAVMTVTARDKRTSTVLASGTTSVIYTPTLTTNVSKTITQLGDSWVAAGRMIQTLLALSAADGHLSLTALGTLGSGPNYHEGQGGWSFQRWNQPLTAPDQAANKFYNPGTGKFDYAYYLAHSGVSTPSDIFDTHLAINDVFSATTDNDADDRATAAFIHAEEMIVSLHAVVPTMKILINGCPMPARHQDGFGMNYGVGQTRRRQKRNAIRWNLKAIAQFAGREASGIYYCPIATGIDPENNFPRAAAAIANSRTAATIARQNNGVHPSNEGYDQAADQIWALLKSLYP